MASTVEEATRALSLAELAKLTKGQVVGDDHYLITGVADLESAGSHDASFLSNPRYANAMRHSEAGVVFVNSQTPLLDGRNYLLTDDPSRAFQITAEVLIGDKVPAHTCFEGIHSSAVVHPTARLGDGVTVGPNAVIDGNAVVGANTTIGANTVVASSVQIGSDCTLHAGVVIREGCTLGNRVILQAGAVIGSCGFGYTQTASGTHEKLRHLAAVVIEDDVEVGANTTIDRGRMTPTRICRGTKIDNLVQIGHNVTVGEDNIIVGQCGLAGSCKTGNRVMIGGQVAINGHIEIGDDIQIAATSGVVRSLPKAGRYGGTPAQPLNDLLRQTVLTTKLGQYVQQIAALEERLKQLEEQNPR